MGQYVPKKDQCFLLRCHNKSISTILWKGVRVKVCETHKKTYGTSKENPVPK